MIEFSSTTASFGGDVVERSLDGVVIAYFTTPTCGPCRMLKPRLEELEAENQNLTVVRFDATIDYELAAEFGIRTVPTLLVYSGGYQVTEITGIKQKRELQELLAKYLED